MADRKKLFERAKVKRGFARESCELLCEEIATICKGTEGINLVHLGTRVEVLKVKEKELKDLDKDIEEYADDEYDAIMTQEMGEIEKYQRMLKESIVLAALVTAGAEEMNKSDARRKSKATKLPVLKPVEFNGDATRFMQFWQSFRSTVDENRDLGEQEKLTYLLSMVRGEALRLVDTLPVTAANYHIAKTRLEEAYGSPKAVAAAHVENVVKLNCVKSHHNINQIYELYRELDFNVRALAELAVGYPEFNSAYFTTVQKLLPKELVLDYHKQNRKSRVSEVVVFLKEVVDCWRKGGLLVIGSKHSETSRSHDTRNERISTASSLMVGQDVTEEEVTAMATGVGGGVTAEKKLPRTFCVLCHNNEHWTDDCNVSRTWEEKRKLMFKKGRCFRCGQRDHMARECSNPRAKCKQCQGGHITALCPEDKDKTGDEVPVIAKVVQATGVKTHEMMVQLGHAYVKGFANSQVRDVVGREQVRLYAFGHESSLRWCDRVMVPLYDRKKQRVGVLEALAVDTVSWQTMPHPSADVTKLCEEMGLELADNPGEGNVVNQEIGILVGVDYYWELVLGEVKVVKNGLKAISTKIGWVLQGRCPVPTCVTSVEKRVMCVGRTLERMEDNNLENLWNLDNVGAADGDELKEQCQPVEIIWQEGRYSVNLPWLEGQKEKLKSNRQEATERCHQLIKRLRKDPAVLTKYHEGMQAYVKNGHASLAKERKADVYIMPHFGVVREGTTTDLRIVFDASAKAEDSPSLNECLSQGQNRRLDVLKMILKFRLLQFAYVADIEKAFLQIKVHKDDRRYLRFLWLNVEEPITTPYVLQEYEMERVTFGVTSSPYLLKLVIAHHLELFRESQMSLVEKTSDNFYVDDLIAGSDSKQGVLNDQRELQRIFVEGNLYLRKWLTNCKEAMSEWKRQEVRVAEQLQTKVMGMKWDADMDELWVVIPTLVQDMTVECSKRAISSSVSSIYDPLGMLSIAVMKGKLLLQELWLEQIDWDDVIVGDRQSEWIKWKKEMQLLEEVKIQRWHCTTQSGKLTLHCFSDASPRIYGAVLYLLKEDEEGKKQLYFLLAKYRLAPLKEKTLPQLELMGATVSARITHYWTDVAKIKVDSIVHWVDSQIALQWIKNHERKRPVFVQNRVMEIRRLSSEHEWKYCPSEMNIADDATRVNKVLRRSEIERWITGPQWLKEEEKWPDITAEEEEGIAINPIAIAKDRAVVDVNTYSSWTRLLRHTAWWLRFVDYWRAKVEKRECQRGSLTSKELKEAEIYWLRQGQKASYCEELSDISQHKKISRKSKLSKFAVFVDEKEILRINSRIESEFYTLNQRYPIVLDGLNELTVLMVREWHSSHMHAGVNHLITLLRNRFWILGVRKVCKRIVRECVCCQRVQSQAYQMQTGNLPDSRVDYHMAFDSIGLDFAGPVYIKGENECRKKSYILLITCMATRAIHLELLTDMSTYRFLLAFQRFLARRGQPFQIYSDNGKTFKRAEKIMRSVVVEGEKAPRFSFFKIGPLRWDFIVERAPWMGGAWERMVGVLKFMLRKVLANAMLDFEEFNTLLCIAEGVVNSRPLTHVPSDDETIIPLTPNQLINGKLLASMPIYDLEKQVPELRPLKRYKYIQALLQHFCRRWKKEYVTWLQAHHQVEKGSAFEPKVGDVVVYQLDNCKRHLFPLGRVVEIQRGRNGIARSAMLQVAGGKTLRRAINMMYPVPCSNAGAGNVVERESCSM